MAPRSHAQPQFIPDSLPMIPPTMLGLSMLGDMPFAAEPFPQQVFPLSGPHTIFSSYPPAMLGQHIQDGTMYFHQMQQQQYFNQWTGSGELTRPPMPRQSSSQKRANSADHYQEPEAQMLASPTKKARVTHEFTVYTEGELGHSSRSTGTLKYHRFSVES